ncbi:MAG: hypothetical protein ISS17_04130 [Bacteroidales bacterium]|nr:hypothetical protein [Bacteroidales bacterium]
MNIAEFYAKIIILPHPESLPNKGEAYLPLPLLGKGAGGWGSKVLGKGVWGMGQRNSRGFRGKTSIFCVKYCKNEFIALFLFFSNVGLNSII